MSHSFHTPENYKKSSYIFSHDTRFKYKKEVEILRSRAPGPGAYNSLSSFKTAARMTNGFGSSIKLSDKVYFKELQGTYFSKHAPGPGAYDNKHYFSEKKPGGKINPTSVLSYKRVAARTGGQFRPKKELILNDHEQFIQLAKKNGKHSLKF